MIVASKRFMRDLFDLSGRTALITGRHPGFVKPMALGFASSAATSWPRISPSTRPKHGSRVEELGRQALALRMDVASQRRFMQVS